MCSDVSPETASTALVAPLAGRAKHGFFALALVLGLTVTIQLDADGPSGQGTAAAAPQAAQAAEPPRGCGTPVSERKTEIGCYMTAETALGVLPSGSFFWHLDAYPSRAAAEAAREER